MDGHEWTRIMGFGVIPEYHLGIEMRRLCCLVFEAKNSCPSVFIRG